MSSASEVDVPLLDVSRQNLPLWNDTEAALRRVCESGQFIHGPDCQQFEEEMAAYCDTQHAVGCASGSDALLLSLMALGVGTDDEVILPSFTFFATAGAVWRLGARPVFVDIEADSFNIDPEQIEAAITPATRAIVPVHLFGRCADMTRINQIAERHGIPVVEDAAQSIGAQHEGRLAGSLGTLGCFSFYPSKNLGGFGDGGMITTNDGKLAEQLCALRNHGQLPQYYHHVVGVNSRLDTLQAAVLRVKLAHLERWTAGREANARRYGELFAAAGVVGPIVPPRAPENGRHVWNQYTVRVPDGRRDALKDHLAKRNIGTAIYYPVPLHLQRCFASLGYESGSLPETERASDEVLSLPIFAELTDQEQRSVTSAAADFVGATAHAAA